MVSAELCSYIATVNLSHTPCPHSEESPPSRPAHQANTTASGGSRTCPRGNLWQVTAAGSWASGQPWAGNLNVLSERFPSRINFCNLNSCPCVSSVGQQLSTSPPLSYNCFQVSPWSHSHPDVCMKASADPDRQEKQSLCLGDIRPTQLHSLFLVKLVRSSCFFLSRLVLKICEEKGAIYFWQNVWDLKSKEVKIIGALGFR